MAVWTFRAVALGALMACAAESSALAVDITVSTAQISAGRLIITGNTRTPGMRVRLDAQPGAAFNVTSDANRAFTFRIVYYPSDCIVALQQFTPPATLGIATNAVVALCGARGLSPRGAWSAELPYLKDDLVTFLGSSWRARRTNSNSRPDKSPADWELFASKGDKGDQGIQGLKGDKGDQGIQGPKGDKGDRGIQGLKGDIGTTGPQGVPGEVGLTPKGAWDSNATYDARDVVTLNGSAYVALQGSKGSSPDANPADWTLLVAKGDIGLKGDIGVKGDQGLKGDTGNTGATGPQGPQGDQGVKGDTGNTGVTGPTGPQGPVGPPGSTLARVKVCSVFDDYVHILVSPSPEVFVHKCEVMCHADEGGIIGWKIEDLDVDPAAPLASDVNSLVRPVDDASYGPGTANRFISSVNSGPFGINPSFFHQSVGILCQHFD